MKAAVQLGADVGVAKACAALAVSRATVYRRRKPRSGQAPRRRDPRALSEVERAHVIDTLNSEPYRDLAPAEVYAELLDQGRYLCSIRTMYRILSANEQVRERRNQLRHPVYAKPELLATGPNQLWSWDITKLKGPTKWTYYHLYVVIDVFSRYVVGWMVAEKESAALAKRFLAETIGKQLDDASELTVHADRGIAMRSKMVAHLLADLGVTKTHSRPYTSNDNAFSESQFKTMKYRPGFPKDFGGLDDAKTFCRPFFRWYNHEHHHHGLALLTPADVHLGRADTVLEKRQEALDEAYVAHPERFSKRPMVPRLAREVWINPPSRTAAEGAPGDCANVADTVPGSAPVELPAGAPVDSVPSPAAPPGSEDRQLRPCPAGAPADSVPSPAAPPGSEDRQLRPSQMREPVTNFSDSVSHSC